MSINRAIISGNLTRDPELRQTASGLAVLTMGVAVNDRRKDPQTGEWTDYPNYIDCTMFGTRAESLSRYLTKGTKVVIEGKLRWSQWERDGQKRSKIEVVVDQLDFMSRNNGNGAQGGNGGYMSSQENSNYGGSVPANPPQIDTTSYSSEDIPF
ncbi:MAG: single-stranded DNA-binding protein [Eggerthellaceae bacterium]|nr:single-stranded DNA-binding protein [Eggerthellaceae bacterium]